MNRDDIVYVALLFMMGTAFSSPEERETKGQAFFDMIDSETLMKAVATTAEGWATP